MGGFCSGHHLGDEQRIALLTEEIDRERHKQRREILCTNIPQFPTFIIDLILEFEKGSESDKIKNAEEKMGSVTKKFGIFVNSIINNFRLLFHF